MTLEPLSSLDLRSVTATFRRWLASIDGFLRSLGTASRLNADADTALTGNSDDALPTQRAVRAYVDGITTDSVAAHVAALDPHSQYLTGAEGNAAYALLASYAPLTLASGLTATGAASSVPIFAGTWPRRVFVTLSGTGAVSATVEIWGTNSHDGDTLLLTFSLAGTGSDSADDWVETVWSSVWVDVTAISGTSATISATTEC